MNAIQVISELKSLINIEHTHLRNALHLRETTVTGAIYTNSDNGENLSPEQYKGRVDSELIAYSKLQLGYGLVERFEYALAVELENSAKSPYIGALRTHLSVQDLTASNFLDHLSEVLEIDEHYFERLLAYTLMFEQLSRNSLQDIKPEDIEDAAQNMKFNNFNLCSLTSSEDGVFHSQATHILGAILLINNICGKSYLVKNARTSVWELSQLNPYRAGHSFKEVGGVKVTAYKGGHIKITVDKNTAENLERKVKPFLRDFHLLFVKTN